MHSEIETGPSSTSNISPTVISLGYLTNRYPPYAPLTLFINPDFFKIENICSKYCSDIFCF